MRFEPDMSGYDDIRGPLVAPTDRVPHSRPLAVPQDRARESAILRVTA